MASAAPHLLTIPREIRDEIYGYLSHEVIIVCGWELSKHRMGKYKYKCVRFENAPIVALLLTHSRLHDEYLQSAPFKNLHISFKLEPCYCRILENTKNVESEGSVIRKAFEGGRTVTISVDCEVGDSEQFWHSVLSTVKSLGKKSPQLSIVRTLGKEYDEDVELLTQHDLASYSTAKAFSRSEATFDEPPRSILDLHLRQRGQEVLYEYLTTDYFEDRLDTSDATIAPTGRRERLFITIHVSAWLFTKDKPEKHWMEPSNIAAYIPVERNPETVLGPLSMRDTKTAERLGKIEQWKEASSENVYAWGTTNEEDYMDLDAESEEDSHEDTDEEMDEEAEQDTDEEMHEWFDERDR
jgi:hypothetical protein